MKTSDVPSNRPVQSGTTNQSSRTEKKPQKEFDKVLDDSKGKQGALSKKGAKPFSPLTPKTAYGKKSGAAAEDKQEAIRGEGKSEKGGTGTTVHREYSRVEARGQRDHGEKEGIGKEESLSKEHSTVDPATQIQNQPIQIQPQTKVQTAPEVQATQRPGLNINEIQSIVRRVELGVSDKGKPEFRFELETKHLGNIDLKVSTENEKVRIEFATNDIRSQELLKENLKELSEMLQQKGLVLAETKFTPHGQDDAEKQQQQREQQEQAEDISPIQGPGRKFSL